MSSNQADLQRKQHEIYSYEANSNLVIEGRRRKGGKDEGTGEAESLRGRLDGVRMGDRVRYDDPGSKDATGAKSSSKDKRVRDGDGDMGESLPRKKSNTGGVADMNDDFGTTYKPRTEDTRMAYEEL